MTPMKPARHPATVFTVVVCLVFFATLAHAAFKPRENRWAAQVQETLLVGDAVWLKDGKGVKFFSIYTAANTAKPKGGVLILHGLGLHPDWPEVISPLRRELPEQGWATLSLQMPILPAGAPLTAFGPIFDETPARIRAGMEFLRGKGIERIVLIGHGLGAAMGAAFLVKEPRPDIAGFIGISMDAPTINSTVSKLDPRLNTTDLMGQLKLPVLDLYGSFDIKRITNLAPLRVNAAQQGGNKDYKQVRVPDADHSFTNHDKNLLGHVVLWLDKHFAAP